MNRGFDYTAWTLMVAAQWLESDVASGFAIADSTPDPEKAIDAMHKLISRLRREADRRPSQNT